MGGEIDLVLRFTVEEQYITGSATLKQLARSTGISVRQLGRWSTDEGWRERRREYRKTSLSHRVNIVELRRRLIEKALKTLDPMDAFASVTLEKLALLAVKSTGAADTPQPTAVGLKPVLRTPGEAVVALKGIIEAKLHRMLTSPDSVSMVSLKEIQHCLELLKSMDSKANMGADCESKKSLTPETAKRIMELYGFR